MNTALGVGLLVLGGVLIWCALVDVNPLDELSAAVGRRTTPSRTMSGKARAAGPRGTANVGPGKAGTSAGAAGGGGGGGGW